MAASGTKMKSPCAVPTFFRRNEPTRLPGPFRIAFRWEAGFAERVAPQKRNLFLTTPPCATVAIWDMREIVPACPHRASPIPCAWRWFRIRATRLFFCMYMTSRMHRRPTASSRTIAHRKPGCAASTTPASSARPNAICDFIWISGRAGRQNLTTDDADCTDSGRKRRSNPKGYRTVWNEPFRIERILSLGLYLILVAPCRIFDR